MNVTNDSTLTANWSRLHDITENIITTTQDSHVQRTMREQISAYNLLFDYVRNDRSIVGRSRNGDTADIIILGMRRAPASKSRHHSVEGGLVLHLLQMWELWVDLRSVIRAHARREHPQLNDLNVWTCILHHDLNKVWKYRLVSQDPWSVDYAGEFDQLSEFLGDTSKSLFLLDKFGVRLTLPQHNALITAEGGYSTMPRPRCETVLAKVAYLLDELSANVVDRLQNNRFWDSKEGGISDQRDT